MTTEEITTVEEAVFGNDIPAATFTVAGMDLPKGKLIDFDGELGMWDGQRVVRQNQNMVDSQRSPERRWMMATASTLLAVFAGLLVWYRRLRRNRSA